MTRATVLLILAAPGVALADSSGWLAHGASSVDIDGVTELTLYRGPDTGHLAAVLATVTPAEPPEEGDYVEHTLARFAIGQPTSIPEDLAKARGFKVKKGKLNGVGDIQVTTIPELRLGDSIVLHDVHAEVGGDALVIGIDTLPIGVAILPSWGTVKVAPLADAASLLEGMTDRLEASAAPTAPWFDMGDKTWAAPLGLRFQGSILGKDGLVFVALERMQSSFSDAVPMPDDAHRYQGLVEAPAAPKLGSVALPASSLSLDGTLVDPADAIVGVLGYESLYGLDLAYDPSSRTLGIKEAYQPKSTDPADVIIDDARKVFEAAAKKDDDADKDDKGDEADDKSKGDPDEVGRQSELAQVLWDHGLTEEAVTHLQAAAAVAGDDCEAYLRLGRALIAQGEAKSAIEPLTQSATLWDKWWSQPIQARTRIDGGHVEEGDYDTKQSSACYEAWGLVAAAHTALDRYDDVAKIYAERTDLDWHLPEVAGIALLEQGKRAEAVGPLRQAVELGGRADEGVRVALGVARTTADDPHLVDELVYTLEYIAADRPLWARGMVIELARAQGQDPVAVARQMVAANPVSSGAALALAVALHQAGDPGEADAIAAAKALVEANGSRFAGAGWVDSQRAVLLALEGDAGKADKILKVVHASSAPDPDYWVAMALVKTVSGDSEGATAAWTELARRHPEVPGPQAWK